jgi:hypothetical protein
MERALEDDGWLSILRTFSALPGVKWNYNCVASAPGTGGTNRMPLVFIALHSPQTLRFWLDQPGANPNCYLRSCTFGFDDARTPLSAAILQHHPEALGPLLCAGADPHMRSYSKGGTVVWRASALEMASEDVRKTILLFTGGWTAATHGLYPRWFRRTVVAMCIIARRPRFRHALPTAVLHWILALASPTACDYGQVPLPTNESRLWDLYVGTGGPAIYKQPPPRACSVCSAVRRKKCTWSEQMGFVNYVL